VVVNQSLKFLRSNQRHEFAPLCDDIADEPETDDPPISDVPPDAIHKMVSRLPTGYRTVFNLYVFEDHSHKEIARLLGISERTSASQLHRAKNLLAKMIQQYHNDKSPRR
jgi:RNA polymerase sigma-70 factor (ECF subfamily)